MEVAVQGPGDPVPVNGSTPITSRNLGVYVQAGTLTINTQPVNQTNVVNGFATFTVGATSSSTLCGGNTIGYEWRSNGVVVAGANGPSLTIGPLPAAADGAIFNVVLTSPARTVVSSNAVLRVSADNMPPRLISARSDSTFNTVRLNWSELMAQGPAVDSGNFVLRDASQNQIFVNSVDYLGSNYVLHLQSPMMEGGVYTLEIDYQQDLAGNSTMPVGNPTVDANGIVTNVYAFVRSCGLLLFEAYPTGGGNAVSDLTAFSGYPNNPDTVRYITAMDSRQVYPTDTREGYGARMTGFFVPQVTTNYTFYLRSDDASELWLSTDATEGNKVKITEETGCCNAFSAHASGSIPLVKGQAYWIQLLYKEGTGGDYGQAAVKFTADPRDPNTLSPINGALLASLGDPIGASIVITQQPPATVLFAPGSAGSPLASQNFNTSDGGFTVTTPQAYDGPWVYNATTGSWQEAGQNPDNGHPNTSLLDSPGFTVTVPGQVILSFNHRWSFEYDGTAWDGGPVRGRGH